MLFAAEHGSDLDVWRELRALHRIDGGSKSGDVLSPFERLPIEPPPGSSETWEELEELHRKQRVLAADLARQAEIVRQATSDDISDILGPLGAIGGGHDATRSLVHTVLRLAQHVGFHYKASFDRPRPSELDVGLRPFLANPAHAAYPSNHAFQMFSVAEVMTRVLPEQPETTELFHVAQRVAENREYAGLHYASDSEAGRRLARQCAPYLVAACTDKIDDLVEEWS